MTDKKGLGDVTSNTRGTGARHNAGKPPLELIPLETLEGIARVLQYGGEKYAPFNWAKGQSWMANLGCALRHLKEFQRGEDNDPDTGESHLAHAGCCILFALFYEIHCKDMDDRPVQLTDEFHKVSGEGGDERGVRHKSPSVEDRDRIDGNNGVGRGDNELRANESDVQLGGCAYIPVCPKCDEEVCECDKSGTPVTHEPWCDICDESLVRCVCG